MALFDPRMFDPASYGGDGGWLSGVLRSASEYPSPITNPTMGFAPPAAQAQPAMPAQGAPTDISAQSRMGAQPESPSFLDGLGNWLGNNSNALMMLGAGIAGGRNWGEGLSAGFQGAAKGRQIDMGLTGKTDDIREFEYAKRQGFTGSLQDWMQRKRSGAGEYSLTPVYGTNEKGETVLLQPGKSGDAIQTRMPPGVKISSGVEKIDAGTHWILYDKRTGNPVGSQPKNIEGKEAAEERGKAQGQAQVTLPNVLANAEQTLKIIDSIKDDPYRERGTGASSVFNAIPATGGFDFAQKVEQLKGKSFLEAFQALKGGGAITEIEGKKAENAIARLNVAQSEGAFMEALNELRDVVVAGMERARTKAGAPAQGAPQAAPTAQPAVAPPKIDTVQDGYRFRGGNPADPKNWVKVN